MTSESSSQDPAVQQLQNAVFGARLGQPQIPLGAGTIITKPDGTTGPVASNPVSTLPASVALPAAGTTLTGGPLLATVYDNGGMAYNAKKYGATCKAVLVNDAAITSGAAILTSASGKFLPSDVGSGISVKGAAAAAAVLVSTILSYQSATQVTLANNAGSTVTNASAIWRLVGKMVPDGAITTGLKVLTSASGQFTAADVGKNLVIQQAGAGPGPLTTTIASFQSATQVTLVAAATFTVSGQVTWWGGTDDAIAVNNAIVQANADGGGMVFMPQGGVPGSGLAGGYALESNPIFPLSNVWIAGAGRDATVVYPRAGGQSGGSQDGFRAAQSAGNYYQSVTITDLTVNGTMQDFSIGNGMTLEGVDWLICERIRVTKPAGFGIVYGTIAAATPYIESPVMRDIRVDNQQSGTNAFDCLGGGGCIRGLVDGYTCINPAGTFMDWTNMQDCIFRNLRGKNNNAVNVRNWALGADFGWINCTIDGFDFDTVYRGIVINSTTGQLVSQSVRIMNGSLRTVSLEAVFIAGFTGTGKSLHDRVHHVDVTNWNVANLGSAGMIFQECSDLEVGEGCAFYAPAFSAFDIQLDKQGAGVGCDTVRIHDNKLLGGVGFTTVVQPIRVYDNQGWPNNTSVTAPTIGVGSNIVNNTGFDCFVYITTGANAITQIQIGGITTSQTIAANQTGVPVGKVRGGQTILLQNNVTGLSWVWIADANP